jgi:hypothetical protein
MNSQVILGLLQSNIEKVALKKTRLSWRWHTETIFNAVSYSSWLVPNRHLCREKPCNHTCLGSFLLILSNYTKLKPCCVHMMSSEVSAGDKHCLVPTQVVSLRMPTEKEQRQGNGAKRDSRTRGTP